MDLETIACLTPLNILVIFQVCMNVFYNFIALALKKIMVNFKYFKFIVILFIIMNGLMPFN